MKLVAEHNDRRFEIVEDSPEVGVYLFIYENGRCVRDELQDSIAICKELALEDWGVSESLWREERS